MAVEVNAGYIDDKRHPGEYVALLSVFDNVLFQL